MPRIWQVGIMNEYRTSNIEQRSVSRDCRASAAADANSRERRLTEPPRYVAASHGPKNNQFTKGHSRFALRTNLVTCRPVQKLATPHKFTAAAPLSREGFPVAFALSVLFLAA